MSTQLEFTWGEEFRNKIAFAAKVAAARLIGEMDRNDLDPLVMVFALENFAPIIKREMVMLLSQIQSNLMEHVQEVYEEEDALTVVLEGLVDSSMKLAVIKAVREITNLGLKEAKELVEGWPKPVKHNIAKDEADALKKRLEEAGAKVSLKRQ